MVLQYLLFALLTLLASVIGTFSGFGISSLLIPTMLLFYHLPTALLMVGVIHLFSNLWKVILFEKRWDWKLIFWFGIPGILASYVGASFIFNLNEMLMKRLLGAALLGYVLFLALNRNWRISQNRRNTVAGGLISGFITGLFGVGGPVRSAFLAAFHLKKEMFIFSSAIIALFIDITRVSRYLGGGVRLELSEWILVFSMVIIALGGTSLTKRFVGRISQNSFRIIISFLLGVIAIKFIVFP